MGVIAGGDGGLVAGILIGIFLAILAILALAFLTAITVLIIYFVKRKDDFTIEEITITENKKSK